MLSLEIKKRMAPSGGCKSQIILNVLTNAELLNWVNKAKELEDVVDSLKIENKKLREKLGDS